MFNLIYHITIIMFTLCAITGIISGPFINHNLRAKRQAFNLVNNCGIDHNKKISVIKGILKGIPYKTITNNNIIISQLDLYKKIVIHEHNILGVIGAYFILRKMFGGNNSDNFETEMQHVSCLKTSAKNLKFNEIVINNKKIKKIFHDSTPRLTLISSNDAIEWKKKYELLGGKEVTLDEILQFSAFQEQNIKNEFVGYLLKEISSDEYVIATLNSREKLEQYVSTYYYNKLSWGLVFLIIIIFVWIIHDTSLYYGLELL